MALAKFFAHESCGKCTPCREGSGWIEKVLVPDARTAQGRPDDLDLLLDFGNNIVPGLDCAVRADDDLPARAEHDEPVVSLDRWFGDEIRERLKRDAADAPRRSRCVRMSERRRRGADEPVAVGPPVHDPGRRRRTS